MRRKFVFAPDSFKGSLSAAEICGMLTAAAGRHFPDAATVSTPAADGDEGTVEALLLAAGGRRATVRVTGPLGGNVGLCKKFPHQGDLPQSLRGRESEEAYFCALVSFGAEENRGSGLYF